MSVKDMKVCDWCGVQNKGYHEGTVATPIGWFRLAKISLYYRAKKHKKGTIKKGYNMTIDETKDPDFCSRRCIDNWFADKLDKLEKGKWKE